MIDGFEETAAVVRQDALFSFDVAGQFQPFRQHLAFVEDMETKPIRACELV